MTDTAATTRGGGRRRLQRGDLTRELIVREYHPLVLYLARRYYGRGEALEDLVQVAQMGLLNAVDRFDPERAVQFSTFAAATILV